MDHFSTSLVREKIVFIDDGLGGEALTEKIPDTVRSNRIFLKLLSPSGVEKVVIRAQNMHSTLRFAARILLRFHRQGSLLKDIDWAHQWDSTLSEYEKKYNQKIWAAVYINGKSVFKTISSPFVDIVEQCALLTIDNYDATMDVTEDALKRIGRAVHINHSSNVAAVISNENGTTRCGIIHRGENQNTTFNFTATGGEDYPRIIHAIYAAADFLEAINLRFIIRNVHKGIKKGEVNKVSKEADQAYEALERVAELGERVVEFEHAHKVKYRPERPKIFATIKS